MNEKLIVRYRNTQSVELPLQYHSHQDYEIYFFHSGECRYLIHNQIYDLKPGDIILMDGLTLHKPNVSPNTEYVRSVIQFSPHWIKGVLEEMGSMYLLKTFKTLHYCLIRTNENEESKELQKLYGRLAELSNYSDTIVDIQVETEIKVLLLQVLIIVNKLVQKNSIEVPDKKEEKAVHAENIADFIQQHFMNKLTLQSIAENLHLSRSYVANVFKTMTGYTVMEFVMECRLTHAKYLLEMEPLKPLKDVAYESGFESATHFSRFFREKVGVTAKEFRQLRLKNWN
ncbi:AraC family transcriptional regulator [Metabacillus halosaccharovorans]|uniref:AraC family transcriptional regulator n=1 Tax=Metabacillus halosaccharovorans TaxID=930124 RepID=UPI001C1FD5A1|nr:AraC family transcriptional regulator [Metabacillus halosaccharovorans]MBU7591163.1 AraC family transcriptional regulator [Metabacillus halosaccharovorans]